MTTKFAVLTEARCLGKTPGTYRTRAEFVVTGSDTKVVVEMPTVLTRKASGFPSGLRRLLNACAGRGSHTAIDWFDDETLEYSYLDNATHRLTAGRTTVPLADLLEVIAEAM